MFDEFELNTVMYDLGFRSFWKEADQDGIFIVFEHGNKEYRIPITRVTDEITLKRAIDEVLRLSQEEILAQIEYHKRMLRILNKQLQGIERDS